MNKKDLKVVETKLLKERTRLIEEMDHLDQSIAQGLKDASGDLSSYSVHMADQGSDAFEREMNNLLSTTEGRLLLDTVEALRRLYRGEYGNCQSCGKKIARERLLAVPQAKLCVSCQATAERRGH
jgi:DnaK suppressor protein